MAGGARRARCARRAACTRPASGLHAQQPHGPLLRAKGHSAAPPACAAPLPRRPSASLLQAPRPAAACPPCAPRQSASAAASAPAGHPPARLSPRRPCASPAAAAAALLLPALALGAAGDRAGALAPPAPRLGAAASPAPAAAAGQPAQPARVPLTAAGAHPFGLRPPAAPQQRQQDAGAPAAEARPCCRRLWPRRRRCRPRRCQLPHLLRPGRRPGAGPPLPLPRCPRCRRPLPPPQPWFP